MSQKPLCPHKVEQEREATAASVSHSAPWNLGYVVFPRGLEILQFPACTGPQKLVSEGWRGSEKDGGKGMLKRGGVQMQGVSEGSTV